MAYVAASVIFAANGWLQQDCRIILPCMKGTGMTVMRIPFCNTRLDGTEIDACTDQLFKSHVQKVEAMKDWDGSPFRIMHITEKRGEGSFLKRIAQKKNCEGCNIGRANKHCVHTLCKKCCNASSEIEKCIAHKKLLVV
jgi:hypothetical protein